MDIVEEILLRLSPVKDLLRCKSVCKSWYSLISSPSFVNLHLKFVCNKENKINNQLGSRRIAWITIFEYTNGIICKTPVEWQHKEPLNIEGSSNGLVCVSSIYNDQICLTNPSTREFRKLQEPPILPKKRDYFRGYGFGYDSSTDDYKLVMAIKQGTVGSLVQILSLKSNVWKVFGHVKYWLHDSKPGILFNGALHWLWLVDANDTKDRKVSIVSFDIAEEKFIEIPQPDDPRYVSSDASSLGIIEDQLCIFHTSTKGYPYGIWVMKNYNSKPTWERSPKDYKIKDNVVNYMRMIKDCTFDCNDNIGLPMCGNCIQSPIFVQTLVSPYHDNGKSSNIKNTNGVVKDNIDIEEVYDLKDEETDTMKRKGSRNIKKSGSKEKREIDEILMEEGEGRKKRRKRNTNKSNI